MLLGDFTDKHSVVCAATVLEEDGKHLPYAHDDAVPAFSMLETFLYQLIETDRIDIERTVDPIDYFAGNFVAS